MELDETWLKIEAWVKKHTKIPRNSVQFKKFFVSISKISKIYYSGTEARSYLCSGAIQPEQSRNLGSTKDPPLWFVKKSPSRFFCQNRLQEWGELVEEVETNSERYDMPCLDLPLTLELNLKFWRENYFLCYSPLWEGCIAPDQRSLRTSVPE